MPPPNLRLYNRLLEVLFPLLVLAIAVSNTLHVLARVSLLRSDLTVEILTCSFVRRVLQTPVTSIMVTRKGITALTAMMEVMD